MHANLPASLFPCLACSQERAGALLERRGSRQLLTGSARARALRYRLLSTETLASLRGAGGDARVAPAAIAGREN